MATRALGPAALLLALLAGCGGGGGTAAKPPAKDPAAGVEEEGTAAAKPAQPGAPAKKAVVKIDESLIPEPGTPIARESYQYAGGSRDPFASVLELNNSGPELGDLDLVAIYYQDHAPAASVAVLHDRISAKQYRVRAGERLGRMKVVDVRQRDVTFSIDDYGTERQETLSLRKQQGGNTP